MAPRLALGDLPKPRAHCVLFKRLQEQLTHWASGPRHTLTHTHAHSQIACVAGTSAAVPPSFPMFIVSRETPRGLPSLPHAARGVMCMSAPGAAPCTCRTCCAKLVSGVSIGCHGRQPLRSCQCFTALCRLDGCVCLVVTECHTLGHSSGKCKVHSVIGVAGIPLTLPRTHACSTRAGVPPRARAAPAAVPV